jgi:tetratricopeptide (TPR) repeat protein
VLIQLYLAEKQWDDAHQAMIILLNKPEGKDPSYEAYYAQRMLQHDGIGEAEAELEKLKKVLPDSPMTREIEARVLRAKNQDAEALKVLCDLEANNKELNVARLGLMVEELGKNSKAAERYLEEAERMLRKHTEKSDRPDRFLPLAQFLGRQGKIAEALDNCKKAQEEKASPETVAQVLCRVVRQGAAAEEPCRRVVKWIKDLLVGKPDSVQLMVCLADVYDYQGQFAEAEKVYGEALKKDAESVMILNNLAWLLAFKNPAKALELINAAIVLYGEGPELLDTRGVIYVQKEDFAQALKDLKEVVVRAPSPIRSMHLALALYKAGKRPEADKAFEDAEKSGLEKKKLHPLDILLYQEIERRRAA